MEKLVGGATPKTLPETRLNLSTTKLTVTLAGVEPAAAVKVETRTATVWPERRTVVSFELEKVEASAGTMRPLKSTPKVAPVARLTMTGAPMGRFVPTRLPVAGWKTSLATIWNWVEEEGTDVTTPSIQSVAEVSRGS